MDDIALDSPCNSPGENENDQNNISLFAEGESVVTSKKVITSDKNNSNAEEKGKFDRLVDKYKKNGNLHPLLNMEAVCQEKTWKMRCTDCNTLISIRNPVHNATKHWGGRYCSSRARDGKRSAEALQSQTLSVKSSYMGPEIDWSNLTDNQVAFMKSSLNYNVEIDEEERKKRRKSITNYMKCQLPEPIAKKFSCLLALAVLEESGSVPLSLFERKAFKRAFEYINLPIPSRKMISNELLDREYEKSKEALRKHLQDTTCFQLSLDSWKRNNVHDGNKILAFCALTHRGAHFVDFVVAEGSRMDAKFYARALEKVAESNDLNMNRCTGLITDSEAACLSGIQISERKFPHTLNIPCQAHCLSLLIKDVVKCDGEVRWALDIAHAMVLCINRDLPCKKKFREQQLLYYNQRKPITLGCETRFGSIVMEGHDIYQSRDAIQSLEHYWQEKLQDKNCTEEMQKAATCVGNKHFWWSLEQTLYLLRPICSLIHHLEADKPFMSQMIPIWCSLRNLFHTWHQNRKPPTLILSCYTGPPEQSSCFHEFSKIFETRYTKSTRPVMHLAYLLDPRFFVWGNNLHNEKVLHANTDAVDGKLADDCLKTLAGCMDLQYTKLSVELHELAGSKGTMDVSAQQFHELGKHPIDLDNRNKGPKKHAKFLKIGKVDQAVMAWSKPLYRRDHISLFEAYPNLARIAHRVIQMHVTSCGVERVWSVVRHSVRDNRSCLKIEKVRKLLSVKAAISIRDKTERYLSHDEEDLDILIDSSIPCSKTDNPENEETYGVQLHDWVLENLDRLEEIGFEEGLFSGSFHETSFDV